MVQLVSEPLRHCPIDAMQWFSLAATNLLVALTLPLWVWAWFISIGVPGAKLVMPVGQYVVFRRAARARNRADAGIIVAA